MFPHRGVIIIIGECTVTGNTCNAVRRALQRGCRQTPLQMPRRKNAFGPRGLWTFGLGAGQSYAVRVSGLRVHAHTTDPGFLTLPCAQTQSPTPQRRISIPPVRHLYRILLHSSDSRLCACTRKDDCPKSIRKFAIQRRPRQPLQISHVAHSRQLVLV